MDLFTDLLIYLLKANNPINRTGLFTSSDLAQVEVFLLVQIFAQVGLPGIPYKTGTLYERKIYQV